MPELTAADPLNSPLQAATVSLKLQIEHPEPATRRKLRRAIETDCLARYQMQKAGGEYRLAIPYEDEADLAWQMDWLRDEMRELAEGARGSSTLVSWGWEGFPHSHSGSAGACPG
ncbi:MAG: hypothetical protein KME35_00540 [Aphanocapsa sp. GSE-SYN-MK-11-07L]|jgi:hypothetical protein|nr:hypothetical protein [Aphanocapsa sp. GSE-SYN-MK-11-07L]